MENILLSRLSVFAKEIKNISDKSLTLCCPWKDEYLTTARVTAAQLQSVLNRFNTDLYQYFNISMEPNADEISNFTSIQLEGDEILAELNTHIKTKSDEMSKPSASYSTYTTKLPQLQLPEFAGDILEWHQFWDQFCSNIDQKELSDVDKLLYLKASLKGEAERIIDGLDTTNKNYNIAVSTLKERYGKEEQIIDAHYSTLSKIKGAQHVSECRETLNEIERHLRVLNSLGEDTNHNHLRSLIMEKFPEDIIYEMKMNLTNQSIDEMRSQLDKIITTKGDANRITKENKTKNGATSYTVENLHIREDKGNLKENKNKFKNRFHLNSSKFNRDYKKFNGDNATRKRTYDNRGERDHRLPHNKRNKVLCIFCKKNHYSELCDNVKSIQDRKSKLQGRCFSCFGRGHRASRCTRRKTCVHCKKFGFHNRAICPKNTPILNEPTRVMLNNSGTTVLQTAVATAIGPSGCFKRCRILMDSGSQRSYVTEQIARELKLTVEEQNHLFVFTFGAKEPQEMRSPLIKLDLATKLNKFKTLYANVVPSITHGIPHHEQVHKDLSDEGRYPLADDGSLSDRVDILIGNDYYYSLMSTQKVQIEENLYLVESEFGWILTGKTSPQRSHEKLSVVTYFQSSCETKLAYPDLPLDNGKLQRLWDLESIGITDSPKLDRDEEAIKHFKENTTFKDNRYFISWPWIEYPPDLPTNFGLAYGRLVNLLKRLDSETLVIYNQTLKEQLDKEIIEPVPIQTNTEHPVHYLPHHGVFSPGKSIRIVYDASAKTKNNKSLNEVLYRGPMLLEDLTGLIIKFRCHAIGIIADIEKAFLQIGLKDKDRDVTRFLWLKDISQPATENNLIHLRFTRVPFGIISSPFLLNATIKHHLSQNVKENVRKAANDIYVDNVVTGTHNVKQATEFYEDAKEAFNQISMNLRDWSSNSKQLMEHAPDSCRDKVVKVLGLDWKLDDDTLSLRIKTVNNLYTKRGILKTVASIFDPCGYTVPIVLPAKLLLQDLWKMKLKWDTPLSQEMTEKWKAIQEDLVDINDIRVERCFTKNHQDQHCQLHCFTDASEKAYAAAVYIRQGKEIKFVIGKSRLVPIKDQDKLKIPRLQLLGVLIGSRLIQFTLQFLEIENNVTEQILWTDSQIVIDWYNSDKLLTPFVSRRIQEIKRNKNLTIRYVPSQQNPADVATRPTSSKEEKENWLAGPTFLRQHPSKWPTRTKRDISFVAGEGLLYTEMSQEGFHNNRDNFNRDIEEMVNEDCTSTSKVNKATNKTDNVNNRLQEIKELQLKHFKEEVDGKNTCLSRNLGLFKDIDGLLRCKGRLKYASWSFDKKYPILLPKHCDFTNSLIKETHEKNYHVGANHTLSLIRESYWIPQGKSKVQQILKKCPSCVKHGGGPFRLPATPALPPERVNFSSPFTFTGLDYLGPILVKNGGTTSKRWICLFTCLAVRAIHLEVVQDLTAEEGLLALRRMIATRGVPTIITSDNALQFKLIADIVSRPYCVKNKIQWKFIPELTPWYGGFYERLVALVKHCMKRTLHKHLLGDSQLSTTTKEIEAVINSRPLTWVDSELEHILKPSDFLSVGKCITMESANDEPLVQGTTTKLDLIKGWKRARVMLEEFKDMFNNRYLQSLRERYNHAHKEPRVTSGIIPTEGQIVQIKGDRNRESWKVGKIVSLIKGLDGMCRVAKVKVGNTIFTRSIAHLYPLEVEPNDNNNFNLNVNPSQEEKMINNNIKLPVVVVKETVTDKAPLEETNGNVTDQAMDVTEVDTHLKNKTTDRVDENIEDKNTDSTSNGTGITNDDALDNCSNTMNKENTKNQSSEGRQRRDAAVRAMEKIRE